MTCAWKEFLSIVPLWLRQPVDEVGKDKLQELRLRINAPPQLIIGGKSKWLSRCIQAEDLSYCINAASRYSPWSAATAGQGYITASGGHRLGICGETVCKTGEITGIRTVTSVCIRVARDFPDISANLRNLTESVLILGSPGWGKTTLLRDLIRQCANAGEMVSVVDERGELFPQNAFSTGKCTDILTGCTKAEGIEMLLRTMSPACIAVDEITAESDCQAILSAIGCGVRLLATAHASSMQDFLSRPVYRTLTDAEVFDHIVILRQDKSWQLERSRQWTTSGSVRY